MPQFRMQQNTPSCANEALPSPAAWPSTIVKVCALILLCGLMGLPPNVYAFDFGEAIKELSPPKQSGTKAPGTEPTGQKESTGAPSLSELGALISGTTVEEETAIGEEIAGRLLGAAPLVQDEKLQRYVNHVGQWLALQSDRPDLTWHFGVLDSEDINAFAAPGGFIFITKGLYRNLNNEAELAGVLGHEIGHVVKQHHLKLIKKSQAIDMGSKLLSRKFGKDKTTGQTISTLIGSGAEIMARGLDKDAEFQADRIGVVLASRAGYDAYGLPMVLQDIGHASLDDSSVALLFKTHPHPETRLQQLGHSMGEKFDAYAEGKSPVERFYAID